jgi:putative ABC transport system permease protein
MLDKLLLVAWEALRANKVRSALTMLGIIIGVMSVVVLISIGQASQSYITQQVQGLGASVLIVTPGNPKAGGGPGGAMAVAQTLTIDDARAIENLPAIEYATASARIFPLIKVGNKQQVVNTLGSETTILNVQSVKIGDGRMFSGQEGKQGRRVVVIGDKLYRDLFVDQHLDPWRTGMKIEGQRYRVVGIMASQGASAFGSVDDQMIIPIRTFQQNLKGGNRLQSVMIKATDPQYLPMVQEQLRELLRSRHKLRHRDDDDFKVQTQAEVLATVGTITNVFTGLLAGIASISLLVGGIGIMNIMLVSVRERTREIGVRKAVGAKRRDILVQFLIESAALSVAGGLIGIVVGLLIAWGATRAFNLPTIISPLAVIGSFVFSAAVGIFFGIYPANHAAKLDPVDALRYE